MRRRYVVLLLVVALATVSIVVVALVPGLMTLYALVRGGG